ncbi:MULTISPECIES: hypothetical protein [unclassified Microcoleus]
MQFQFATGRTARRQLIDQYFYQKQEQAICAVERRWQNQKNIGKLN